MSDPDRLQRLERAARRCLELLEGGRTDAAWSELAAALRGSGGSDALGAALSDVELEQAFEAAHPVTDEVIDADRVAQQAMRDVDRELVAAPAAPPATFATGTMAELLERQGDPEGARRIRASLADRESRAPAEAARRGDRDRRVATLERWLSNLRRGASA